MTLWATSVIETDEHPTDTGGGPFTTMLPPGLLPVEHPQQPADADFPLPGYMVTFTVPEEATGASISIF